MNHLTQRPWFKPAVGAGLIVLFLGFYIDDWGRDFTNYEASLSSESTNAEMRDLVRARSADDLVQAVKMAGRRIRNWEFKGEVTDGELTAIHYVRRNRLLRLKDDVVLKISEASSSGVVDAESRARLHVGDLGRNPRNLQRFMSELSIVLRGSVRTSRMGNYAGPTE